jgi:hypothetical protein
MLGEEHRLKGFEIMMLTRIFGRKRNKIVGGWWKLRNEEPHNTMFFAKYNYRMIKANRMRWAKH